MVAIQGAFVEIAKLRIGHLALPADFLHGIAAVLSKWTAYGCHTYCDGGSSSMNRNKEGAHTHVQSYYPSSRHKSSIGYSHDACCRENGAPVWADGCPKPPSEPWSFLRKLDRQWITPSRHWDLCVPSPRHFRHPRPERATTLRPTRRSSWNTAITRAVRCRGSTASSRR